jgi:hypothetical protein
MNEILEGRKKNPIFVIKANGKLTKRPMPFCKYLLLHKYEPAFKLQMAKLKNPTENITFPIAPISSKTIFTI